MKTFARVIITVVLSVCPVVVSMAGTTAQAATTVPAASRYYPFVGHWKGKGQLSEPGQQPTALALTLACSKASSGWAVRCEMAAKNKDMRMTESDLMGVDPVSGQGHWYAITNQGETHDHLTRWPDAHTMTAHYAWTQGGKKMNENIRFAFQNKRSMEFRSVVTADGEPAGEFSGSLKR